MSSFTDTKEREQTVDFVTYFCAGILWAQRPGTRIDPNNACGKKVAVQATTTEETEELPAKSKACTDAGKPPIEIVKFDGQDAATNAVVLGQADAMSADSPVTLYAIKQSNGKLEQAGRDLRLRALRLAGQEGLPAGAVAAEGARAPDRDGQLQEDRHQLGCRERHDRQAGDQRRGQLTQASTMTVSTYRRHPPAPPPSMRFRCGIRGGGWRRSSSSSWRRCSSTAPPPTRPTAGTPTGSTSSTSGYCRVAVQHLAADRSTRWCWRSCSA